MKKAAVRVSIWPFYLALFLTTLVVYSRAGSFGFVNYDDPFYVSHNPHVRNGLSLDGVKWALTSTEGANWFPVTRLSHLIDVQLFGMESGEQHLVNVVIHAISALLLFGFLYGLTRARWPSALVAAIFALHPLHVESVAWISERKDVLCTFFWILALWAYQRSRPVLVVAAFCLGLMSKPMIVTLPFVLILIDAWQRREWKPRLRDKLPLFALSAAAAIATYFVQQASGAVRTFTAIPFAARVENALVSYVVYTAKFLWPAGLAVFYPYPRESQLWFAVIAVGILAGVSVAVIRRFPSRPYLAVGWLWYVVTLLPVIGIIQVGGQARADRYMYVPMIGLAIMLVWGAADLLQARPQLRPVIMGAAAVACAGCVIVTWNQAAYWHDSVALFQHAVEVTDHNDVAQHNLGNALLEMPGRLPDAVTHLQAAIAINPDSAAAHTDLGNAYARMPGRLSDAVGEYRAAIRIDANLPIPHANLGAALLDSSGSTAEANTECQMALRLDPEFAAAQDCIGRALVKSGHPDESLPHFEEALRLDADSAAVHDHLGQALAALPGRQQDAIAQYQLALRLDPGDQDARNNLGVALANDPSHLSDAIAQYEAALQRDPNSAETQYNLALALAKTPGRLRDAIAHFEAALRLDPRNAEAHNNLGFALTGIQGRMPEAISHFEAAIRLNPDYADAHYNLGVALANSGRVAEAIRQFEAAERLKPDPELEKIIRRLRSS